LRPRGADQPRRLQRVDDLPQILFGYFLVRGNFLQCHTALVPMKGEIEHEPHAIPAFGGEFHNQPA
jgi:hypothetical protein